MATRNSSSKPTKGHLAIGAWSASTVDVAHVAADPTVAEAATSSLCRDKKCG